MRAIWKYPLQLVVGPQTVEVPGGSRLVHVALQHERPTLWFDVDVNDPIREPRTYLLVGTGSTYQAGEYCGTVHPDPFVFHVLRIPDPDVRP